MNGFKNGPKNGMDRRQFLKYQLQGMLWVAGGSLLMPARSLAAKSSETKTIDGSPDLAVVKGGAEAATRAAVEMLGGMKQFVKKGARVVIKPNMSFPTPPERAANTHPAVVQTLTAMCKQAGADRVLVLDNPLAPEEQCIEGSGIAKACESVEEDMVHTVTNPSRYKEVDIPKAKSLTQTDVMREVLSADVLIAAPVAKSHSSAGVSLSMKGMMGLIYNRSIMHQRDLHETITDLASLLTPQLVVIDATRVLSTGGPGGPGKVLTPDTVIASQDMVAADSYAVSAFEWYGKRYSGDQIRHIRLAHQRELGRMDIDNLNVKKIAL
ncbi:MAG: DUF362 domain-containing protein [Thermodesulfobacteriota bacterium]